MNITEEHLTALVELQDIDKSIIRLRKEVDSLPEKQLILELRQKRAAIQPKKKAVLALKDDVLVRVSRLEDDIANMEHKVITAQQRIESSQGNFRSAESASRELEGHVKHLDDLQAQYAEVKLELTKANTLLTQISDALSALDEKEQQAIGAYRSRGGELMTQIAHLEKRREGYTVQIPNEVLVRYERLIKAKQGVALSKLQNRACDACRNVIDDVHMINVKKEAPLATCPHCGRMMVVDATQDLC